MVLSAINPFIYATRIHRFKVQIKKLLHISLASTDRHERYEIRQSFKVKKNDAIVHSIIANERTDSGVGASNEAYEESEDETVNHPTLTAAESYEIFRNNRALSRISESPESYLSSPTSDWDYVFCPPAVKPPVHDQTPQDTSPPEDIEQMRSLSEDNIAPLQNDKSNNILPSGSVMFPAPVTVNCDSDSEYFKLIVRRIVHYADHDSDNDELKTDSSARKSKKKSKKSKVPSISLQRSDSIISIDPESATSAISRTSQTSRDSIKSNKYKDSELLKPSSPNSSDQRSVRLKNDHRRGGSTCSVTSFMFNNDEVTVEVSEEIRKPKWSNGGITPIPSPRPNHVQYQTGTPYVSHTMSSQRSEINTPNTQKSTLLKDIWQGTLSKLKKSKRPLDKMSSAIGVEGLTDDKERVVHRRSRSAIEDGVIDYPPLNVYNNLLHSKSSQKRNVIARKPRTRHASLSETPEAMELSSYTSTNDNLNSCDKPADLVKNSDSHELSPTSIRQNLPAAQTPRNFHLTRRGNSMPRRSVSNNNSLVLPIRFCLASGLEEGGFITKQTIYQDNNYSTSRPFEKPAKRTRSGSQPNLHEQSAPDKTKVTRQTSASASLSSA